MITPAFDCTQDDQAVTVRVKLPYIRSSDIEYDVSDGDGIRSEVTVSVGQYFLRLKMPGRLEDGECLSDGYDIDTGFMTIVLRKSVPGDTFEGLEMLSRLVVGREWTTGLDPERQTAAPCIEVVGETLSSPGDGGSDSNDDILVEETERLAITSPKVSYGFGSRHWDAFRHRQDDVREIVEIPDPDNLPIGERTAERQLATTKAFSEDHYLADHFAPEDWIHVMDFNPALDQSTTRYTDDELRALVTFPRREYLADVDLVAWPNLANILFAYCYDKRTTLGEPTVESSWTISRISPTLSWLEDFTSIRDSLLAAFARSLCYPLYRNFDLSRRVLEDTKALVRSGAKSILRALLSIRELFETSESRHLLNVLYITDFAVWLQSKSSVAEFQRVICDCDVVQSDLPWNLDDLVRLAS